MKHMIGIPQSKAFTSPQTKNRIKKGRMKRPKAFWKHRRQIEKKFLTNLTWKIKIQEQDNKVFEKQSKKIERSNKVLMPALLKAKASASFFSPHLSLSRDLAVFLIITVKCSGKPKGKKCCGWYWLGDKSSYLYRKKNPKIRTRT